MNGLDPRGDGVPGSSSAHASVVQTVDVPLTDALSRLSTATEPDAAATMNALRWAGPSHPDADTVAPVPEPDDFHFTMTVAEAAVALDVSCSTLRRWSDSGRLRTIRTPGRHRRFFEDDVWRLKRAADNAKPPLLRPARLPDAPITSLIPLLTQEGRTLLRRAVFLLYEPGREGWFGSAAGAAELDAWLVVLRSAAAGDRPWQAVMDATDALTADARQGGAGPADGPLLIELVSDLLQHRLFELGASLSSRGAARKLLRAVAREMMVRR